MSVRRDLAGGRGLMIYQREFTDEGAKRLNLLLVSHDSAAALLRKVTSSAINFSPEGLERCVVLSGRWRPCSPFSSGILSCLFLLTPGKHYTHTSRSCQSRHERVLWLVETSSRSKPKFLLMITQGQKYIPYMYKANLVEKKCNYTECNL